MPAAACGGDGEEGVAAPDRTELVRTWTLRSVNGDGVPWVAGVTDTETLELAGGTLTFTPADTFRLTLRWRVEGPDPREREIVHRGRYVAIGDVIWFPSSGELNLSGKREGPAQIRLLGRFFEEWRSEFFTDEWAFLRFL